MKNGCIYILRNPAFPNLLKIGQTSRHPEHRAREISTSTGVPSPYKVAYQIDVHYCDVVERKIHNYLADYRHNENREFFELPLDDAVEAVEGIVLQHKSKEAFELEKQASQLRLEINELIRKMGRHLPNSESELVIPQLFVNEALKGKLNRNLKLIAHNNCDRNLVLNIAEIVKTDQMCSETIMLSDDISQTDIEQLSQPSISTCVCVNWKWLSKQRSEVVKVLTLCRDNSLFKAIFMDGIESIDLPSEADMFRQYSTDFVDIFVSELIKYNVMVQNRIMKERMKLQNV